MVNAVKMQLTKISLIAGLFILPALGYAQSPGSPPGGDGGDGTTPFGPAAPIDNKMDLVFLAAGILFAVIVFIRIQKNRASKKQVVDRAE